MRYGLRVVTRTGEFRLETDIYEFEDGVLYCYDEDEGVLLAIPKENVEYVAPCELDNEPEETPPEPAKESAYATADSTPDPGPGYRLIDKAVDKPQEGDEYWSYYENAWARRVCDTSLWSDNDTYRRRVTPEPVCKREAFSGGGSPSPRECGVCGEGPCEKKPVESPDDWVTQDRVPYRREFDECRWGDCDVWYSNQDVPHCYRHGYIGCGVFQHKLQVRCRRKDLPQLPTEIHIGDSVVITESPKRDDSWDGCRRTVQAKVKNGYVVGKVGEPISRIYLDRELRVIPKREESTNG